MTVRATTSRPSTCRSDLGWPNCNFFSAVLMADALITREYSWAVVDMATISVDGRQWHSLMVISYLAMNVAWFMYWFMWNWLWLTAWSLAFFRDTHPWLQALGGRSSSWTPNHQMKNKSHATGAPSTPCSMVSRYGFMEMISPKAGCHGFPSIHRSALACGGYKALEGNVVTTGGVANMRRKMALKTYQPTELVVYPASFYQSCRVAILNLGDQLISVFLRLLRARISSRFDDVFCVISKELPIY